MNCQLYPLLFSSIVEVLFYSVLLCTIQMLNYILSHACILCQKSKRETHIYASLSISPLILLSLSLSPPLSLSLSFSLSLFPHFTSLSLSPPLPPISPSPSPAFSPPPTLSHPSIIPPHPLSPLQACKKSPNPVGYGLAKGDVKLLAVPLIFFILRIWTSVIDSGLHYTSDTQQNKFRCSTAAGVIAVLAVSLRE